MSIVVCLVTRITSCGLVCVFVSPFSRRECGSCNDLIEKSQKVSTSLKLNWTQKGRSLFEILLFRGILVDSWGF
ncbi:hypothetical protein Q3G72_006273 [Acer saccharum]|nr:hypothetical protein Q3G72_006273 [Acer saccharum]